MRARVVSHGGLVLVVDDDPEFRCLMKEVLEREHLFSIEAANGEEALEVLTRVRPDLITLDLEMPKLNGWQVLGALQRDRGLASIPVFVISSCSLADSGLVPGAVALFCKKPVDLNTLLPPLRRRFPREAVVAPTVERNGNLLLDA